LGYRVGKREEKDVKIHKMALGTALMLLSGYAYGTQLLTNPDFETGLISPWTNDNSVQAGSWTITSTGCHGGTYCVTEVGDVGLVQTFSPISTAAVTSVKFWIDPTNMITVALLYQGGGVDNFFFVPTGGQVGVWSQIDETANLRSSGQLIGIEVLGFSGGATKLDDFSILATAPEPGAFWLLATGLGMIGGMARRKKGGRKS
jgi:hypothetical protein